jgi:hypothetical protein
VATPAQVDAWVGLDVGESEQGDLEALLHRAARHGTPGLVIDHNAALIWLARRRWDVILAMLRIGQHDHGARTAQPAGLADAA